MSNFSKTICHLILFVSVIIFLFIVINILKKAPVFADGSQHVWITEYVYKNHKLPMEDITGIQPANLNIPQSIKTNRPFVYQPVYYVLTGFLSLITKNPECSVNVVNIVSIILAAYLLFFSVQSIFDQKTALVGFLLFLFSNTGFWLIVHRITEPFIILLFQLVVFLFIKLITPKNDKNQNIYLIFLNLTLVILFATKQSTIPIFLASLITLVFMINWKKIIIFLIASAILLIPLFSFNFQRVGAPYTLPIGIKPIDRIFKNAWWNQTKQGWEIELDNDVSSPQMREYTYDQFTEVQISPQKLFGKKGILGLLNEFSFYPLADSSNEGYQSTIPSILENFFLLLLIIFFLQSLKKKYKLDRRIKIFLISIYSFVILFWFKQPTFRYYVYIDIFSVIIFAYVITNLSLFFNKEYEKKIKILLLTICFYLVTLNLYSEINRIGQFKNTAGYRIVPNFEDGLYKSIDYSRSLSVSTSKPIFTPMVEISFYSKRSQLWDARLFFTNDQNKLLNYLKNYSFDYVVLPFYSGSSTKKDWKYYDGVPSDSIFYDLLNDSRYFKIENKNSVFTVYKRI